MASGAVVILGGTGTLAPTAELLARRGERVVVTARRPQLAPSAWEGLGIEVLGLDRDDTAGLDALLNGGTRALIDGLCYTPSQAASLARWSREIDSTVVLSARAVYVDAAGRHANSDLPPVWHGPTTEDTPTMRYAGEPYDSREGYGANKAEAERVLSRDGSRVSILRPARIHGPRVRRVREWPLLRAALNGARELPVRGADVGGSLTSTEVVAHAVQACLDVPADRVLNLADAPAPLPLALARALLAPVDPALELSPAEDDPQAITLPWGTGQVLSTARLAQLVPELPDPLTTMDSTARWLLATARRGADGSWELPPQYDGS